MDLASQLELMRTAGVAVGAVGGAYLVLRAGLYAWHEVRSALGYAPAGDDGAGHGQFVRNDQANEAAAKADPFGWNAFHPNESELALEAAGYTPAQVAAIKAKEAAGGADLSFEGGGSDASAYSRLSSEDLFALHEMLGADAAALEGSAVGTAEAAEFERVAGQLHLVDNELEARMR